MKPYTLTNREGESISPMTSTKTVFDEHGTDLDTLLIQQRQAADNALKDYAKKTEVTQDLSGKQEKLSTTTDLHITDDNILGLTKLAKMRLFIDLFNEAASKGLSTECGRYDPENAPDPEHPFYLNGLWLTYNEALKSYSLWDNSAAMKGRYYLENIRTNIPMRHFVGNIDMTQAFMFSSAEIICLTSDTDPIAGTWNNTFARCPNLRKIIGFINSPSSNTFDRCIKLEDVHIYNPLGINIVIAQSPKLSLNSVHILVNNWTSKGYTVTVHSDVYAKLTGDTTNAAAAALTEEELAQWQQLIVDAAEKQIIFATT